MTTRAETAAQALPSGDSSIAEAYDAAADRYDEAVAGDAWVRTLLWRRYTQHFRPGQLVLDVACGTGIDALYLAARGIRVHAIDASPGMILRTNEKIVANGVGAHVWAEVLDISDLATLPAGAFDGAYSSFAGLNTRPDLREFARDAARLLHPRGVLIVHMLNPFSLWEWLGLFVSRRWEAARRLSGTRTRAFAIGGRPVTHYLREPNELYASCFEPAFRLLRLYGIGAICPPATLARVPLLVRASLARLDRLAGPHRPWSSWGRFYVLELERR